MRVIEANANLRRTRTENDVSNMSLLLFSSVHTKNEQVIAGFIKGKRVSTQQLYKNDAFLANLMHIVK